MLHTRKETTLLLSLSFEELNFSIDHVVLCLSAFLIANTALMMQLKCQGSTGRCKYIRFYLIPSINSINATAHGMHEPSDGNCCLTRVPHCHADQKQQRRRKTRKMGKASTDAETEIGSCGRRC